MRVSLSQDAGSNGYEAIALALKAHGISHVYSLAGNPMYPTLGACFRAGLEVVGCRSQNGAMNAAMAQNYRAGALKAAVVCSPSPGVTNSVTGLSDALSHQWPLLLIGGVMEDTEKKSSGFQSFDGAKAVESVCKATIQITDRSCMMANVGAALNLAAEAPPGPVFVEVGAGVLNARAQDATCATAPATTSTSTVDPTFVDAAERPILVLGESVCWGGPRPAHLQELIEALNLPVLASPMGRGILDDTHPNSVFTAKSDALENCDYVLLCGAELDWRFHGGGGVADDVPRQRISPDLEGLVMLLDQCQPRPERAPWVHHLAKAHQQGLQKFRDQAAPSSEDRRMNRLCEVLSNVLPAETLSIIDSGLALSSGHNLWPVRHPFSRITPGQNGTMGRGIPLAMGAAIQEPGRPVVALVGDVGFGLAAHELETAHRIGASFIVVVADNGGINGGEIQDRHLPRDAPGVTQYSTRVDYAQVARGWGAEGLTAAGETALKAAIEQALQAEGPTVISVPMASFRDGALDSGVFNHG